MIKDASIQYCAFRISPPWHSKAESLCTIIIREFFSPELSRNL